MRIPAKALVNDVHSFSLGRQLLEEERCYNLRPQSKLEIFRSLEERSRKSLASALKCSHVERASKLAFEHSQIELHFVRGFASGPHFVLNSICLSILAI